MEIQVRERRGGQLKVKGGESGNVPGPKEMSWEWGWVERRRKAGAEAAVAALLGAVESVPLAVATYLLPIP